MSDSAKQHAGHRRRPWAAPLVARSAEEPHRAATPLELFFDLVIVVAVAQAAQGLHHALAEGHAAAGVHSYAMVFFGIWWAWVNFTWFASAYDNDDVTYRVLVLVQLTGALVFAAGIPSFQRGDLTLGVAGYVLMRMALVTLWLRAAKGDPSRCRSSRRYALGVSLVQVAWVGLLFLPRPLNPLSFWALAACELLVPAWAERTSPTPWHRGHIAERYGLFTIITLGESILAASIALQSALQAGASATALLPVIAGGLLIVFSCWWLYFDLASHEPLDSLAAAFVWGYGHYFVFASVAAIGAGLAVSVDHAMHATHISDAAAGASVAVPVAMFLCCLCYLHVRRERSIAARLVTPLVGAAALVTPFTAQPVLAAGVLMAGLAVARAARAARH